MKKVLVVAAHPDDEVLGAGGTIAKFTAENVQVKVQILGTGISSRFESDNNSEVKKQLKKLRECSVRANSILGVSDLIFHDFPDNMMDTVPLLEVAKTVEDVVEKFRPDLILSHFGNDLNVDHRVTSDAVMIASRPRFGKHQVKEILFFEINSSTGWRAGGDSFNPNTFNILDDNSVEKKLEALRAYQSEMYEYPNYRSIESVQNTLCSRGNFVAHHSAEAFMTVRRLYNH